MSRVSPLRRNGGERGDRPRSPGHGRRCFGRVWSRDGAAETELVPAARGARRMRFHPFASRSASTPASAARALGSSFMICALPMANARSGKSPKGRGPCHRLAPSRRTRRDVSTPERDRACCVGGVSVTGLDGQDPSAERRIPGSSSLSPVEQSHNGRARGTSKQLADRSVLPRPDPPARGSLTGREEASTRGPLWRRCLPLNTWSA